jgi:PST family polysaccharide transporter
MSVGPDDVVAPAARAHEADGPGAAGGPSVATLVGRSAGWSTLDVALGRVAQFAQGVVVARLLAPEAFGVFAVALVVHAIVVNVSELGVSAALVRDSDEQVERGGPTVATIALVSGAVLGLAMALSAPALATALGSPDAAGAVAVLALTLPLAGASAVPAAILRRRFRMDRILVANLANIAVTGVVVIALAVAGWGPMALAWSWVAGQLLTTVVLLTYRPARYRPGWDPVEARRLLRFGLPLAGANIIVFAVLNVDYVVVGRMLGATALGLYVLAFNIAGWPVTVFGSVIRSVSLPGFARIRLDGRDVAEGFVGALGTVGRIAIPTCFVLAAVAGPLVVTVYGDNWSGASAALVGLAFMGAARLVLELSADYLVSLGRTRAVLVLQVPWLIGLLVALVIGVGRAGIAGAGIAQAAVAIGLMLPAYAAVLARTGVRPAALVRVLAPPVTWAVVAGAVAWGGATAVSSLDAGPAIAALAGAGAGMVVVLLANRDAVRAVLVHVAGQRAARGAGAEGRRDDVDGEVAIDRVVDLEAVT